MRRRHSTLEFAGSIHFITTVTRIRGNWFVDTKHCRRLLELFEGYRRKYELECLGYVLMPDHLHVLLHQPDSGPAIENCLRDFKKMSARKSRPLDYPDGALWAAGYDDVPVPGGDAVLTKIRYMHNNPLRREMTEVPEDYPWSSASLFHGASDSVLTVALDRIPAGSCLW